ncbi:putative RNA-directed DNA polymerase from transposon X-element [Trichonephila clavipes]|nr:putative RNA-directed DNA polymerase from transposon X-element [Trichonephila clavipes]
MAGEFNVRETPAQPSEVRRLDRLDLAGSWTLGRLLRSISGTRLGLVLQLLKRDHELRSDATRHGASACRPRIHHQPNIITCSLCTKKNTEKLIKMKELQIMYLQDLIEIETFDKDITDAAQLEALIKEKAQAELEFAVRMGFQYRGTQSSTITKRGGVYVIPSPADCPLKVVIKGLSSSTSIEDIKTDLTEQGAPVIKVAQLTQRKSKFPLPIFMVEVRKNAEDAMDMYDVSKCCYMSIVIDPFKKRPGATKCYNCNYFNHSFANCEMFEMFHGPSHRGLSYQIAH